jgi:hypothetical protein
MVGNRYAVAGSPVEIIRGLAASADTEEGYQDMREAFEILTEREK